MKTISIIGAGTLGTSIISHLGLETPYTIIATRRNVDELRKLQKQFPHVNFIRDNREAVKKSDVIILATKETQFEEVSNEIKEIREGKLLISLAPVCTLEKLTSLFGPKNIRLVMPAYAKEDIVCFAADAHCDEQDEAATKNIIPGELIKVGEKDMHIAASYTLFRGVMNSFFDPLCKAGAETGMEESLARKMMGALLVSAGHDIANGVDSLDRLKWASYGLSEESFTMKLYKKLNIAQNSLEQLFRETCAGFKK